MPTPGKRTDSARSEKRDWRPWVRILGLALVCCGLGWLLQAVLFPLDAYLYDAGLTARPPRVPEGIYVVGLDEKFMAGKPPSLTPRDKLARLLNNIGAAKPRAVELDVVLDSRVDEGPRGVDQQLRDALQGLLHRGVRVVLSDVPLDEGFVSSSLNGMTSSGSVLPYFSVGTHSGSVEFTQDPDGIVRELPSVSKLTPVPLLLAQGEMPGAEFEALRKRMEREAIPIDYRAPAGKFHHVSAGDLLSPAGPFIAQGYFKNAIVLIGATYPRSRDYFKSPYPDEISLRRGAPIFGVELLANCTATLRDGGRRQSHWTVGAQLQDFVILVVFAVTLLVLARTGALAGIVGVVALLGSVSAVAVFSAIVAPDASFLAGLLGHRFHPAAAFFIALPLAAGLGIGWRQWEQAKELRMVRDTFAAYVGPEVLETLGGRMPKLGGEVRQIAVLFCDIRGYSALAEKMRERPEELMTELNNHFQPLVNALKRRGAYVDNYVGDLVMALFGAPVGHGDEGLETRLAVRAALDFVQLVKERNELRVAEGLPAIEIGVGVHCGEAVVGNLGTLDPSAGGKIHYTAIGDAVNLASRVESTTRKFDVPLLITEEAVRWCWEAPPNEGLDLPEWEFVAETTVKGRETPVRLYRPRA